MYDSIQSLKRSETLENMYFKISTNHAWLAVDWSLCTSETSCKALSAYRHQQTYLRRWAESWLKIYSSLDRVRQTTSSSTASAAGSNIYHKSQDCHSSVMRFQIHGELQTYKSEQTPEAVTVVLNQSFTV